MSKCLEISKEWIYNKIYVPLRRIYYRRWTKYTQTGKIALCCIAKMENEYIRYFVDYYKDLCFDKIFLYDNNDPDGERFDDVLGEHIQNNFVKIIDFRGEEVAQLRAYQDCYNKHNKEYSWIAFFDCDEFLTFADGTKDIHSFLRKTEFMPYQVIHINWQVYGDNDQLDSDGRSVIERFKNPILPYAFKAQYSDTPENNHVKSIIRGGSPIIVWKKTPHTPISRFLHCCNPLGNDVDINSPFQSYDFSVAYIRHYTTKTIGEWVRNKMRRGIPDRSRESWRNRLNLDFFFRYNKKTKEKLAYVKKIEAEYAEVE
jgi:hypothetical protein